MNILLFIAVLVVLILVHEFGHFIVAKKLGIRVDEFSIGFGPAWFKKKYGETVYSFKPILAGGYVKIFGEDPNDESISGPDSARSFVHKAKWIQISVIVAGVVFNILLAWVIFSAVFIIGMPSAVGEENINTVKDPQLVILEIFPDSPALEAGLKPGDTMLSLSAGGKSQKELTPNTVSSFISERGEEELTLQYERGGETFSVIVIPSESILTDDPGRAAIGISMGIIGTLQYPPHIAVWEGAKFTYSMIILVSTALAGFFINIFTFSADFSQVAGPIGIVGLVGDIAELGFVSLLMFVAIISLNLAIINVLPFPALDGGRLLFILIEMVKGSPIRPKIANMFNLVGFALLILLMLVVSYFDIIKAVTN